MDEKINQKNKKILSKSVKNQNNDPIQLKLNDENNENEIVKNFNNINTEQSILNAQFYSINKDNNNNVITNLQNSQKHLGID